MLRRVSVVLQVNSLKTLHQLGPAVSMLEDLVPGTDFLSWIWWERDFQVFSLHLLCRRTSKRRHGPHVRTRTEPGACLDLTWEVSAFAAGMLGCRKLICLYPRKSRLAFLLSGKGRLAEREVEGLWRQAQERM